MHGLAPVEIATSKLKLRLPHPSQKNNWLTIEASLRLLRLPHPSQTIVEQTIEAPDSAHVIILNESKWCWNISGMLVSLKSKFGSLKKFSPCNLVVLWILVRVGSHHDPLQGQVLGPRIFHPVAFIDHHSPRCASQQPHLPHHAMDHSQSPLPPPPVATITTTTTNVILLHVHLINLIFLLLSVIWSWSMRFCSGS